MGEVIGISQPNTELIDLLENLMQEAKAGKLTSIAAVVLRDNETDFEIQAPDFSSLEMIGALECLKIELIANE
ncbi:MAG: hypothetical protein JKY24_02820 [Pseudomonadales bacterium]|nr:hypothetical protein [Pseudomonadales bacterium]